MTWRGTTTAPDRIFACLPYLLPLIEGLAFGRFIFEQFPAVTILLVPLFPIIQLYQSIPFAGLIIFFVLLLAVVRNESINHFIRFNTMQAILLDIILVVFQLIFSFLGGAIGAGLVGQTIANVVFLGIIAAITYSVVQSALGRYPEIPTISEAVHMQVR